MFHIIRFLIIPILIFILSFPSTASASFPILQAPLLIENVVQSQTCSPNSIASTISDPLLPRTFIAPAPAVSPAENYIRWLNWLQPNPTQAYMQLEVKNSLDQALQLKVQALGDSGVVAQGNLNIAPKTQGTVNLQLQSVSKTNAASKYLALGLFDGANSMIVGYKSQDFRVDWAAIQPVAADPFILIPLNPSVSTLSSSPTLPEHHVSTVLNTSPTLPKTPDTSLKPVAIIDQWQKVEANTGILLIDFKNGPNLNTVMLGEAFSNGSVVASGNVKLEPLQQGKVNLLLKAKSELPVFSEKIRFYWFDNNGQPIASQELAIPVEWNNDRKEYIQPSPENSFSQPSPKYTDYAMLDDPTQIAVKTNPSQFLWAGLRIVNNNTVAVLNVIEPITSPVRIMIEAKDDLQQIVVSSEKTITSGTVGEVTMPMILRQPSLPNTEWMVIRIYDTSNELIMERNFRFKAKWVNS